MQNVEALFAAYRDEVYRLAVSYTRNIQEAEDVCQTVFLKLMEQKSIRPGREKAWLMQVTANQCRSLLRSGWWKKTVPLEESAFVATGETGTVLQEVLRDRPYYRRSGGGMTLSGGESLYQPQFAMALLQACRENGIQLL